MPVKFRFTKFHYLSLAAAIGLICVTMNTDFSLTIFHGFLNENLFLYQNETDNDCIIPELDPWDPAIMTWIEHLKGLHCRNVQPFMTFVDYDGYLRINATEVDSMMNKNRPFNCYYQTFDRKIGLDDNALEYDERIKLNNFTKLTKYNVDVKCFYDDGQRFYWNMHAHPVRDDVTNLSKPTEDQLSVLLFMIDSVSFSVLQRNLPLTYNYTKNVMGIKYFKAYNKVAINTFPNVLALVTGKRVYDEQEDMKREIDTNASHAGPFDDWPLIWKMFQAKGYTTAFNEDLIQFALFHYMAEGFTKKAFDYNYHHFWSAVYAAEISGQTAECFGNDHRTKIMLDITKRQVVALKDKLQFVFSAYGELSHRRENDIEIADEELLDFWKEMSEGNYLNNTFIIFFSDHGIRYGNIRRTTTGMLEEQLPFFGLWFPPWFYRKYPHLRENINENSKLLTANFDAHETLKDVLNLNYRGRQRNDGSRGQSQLYPLPKNRNCKSAGIPNSFCACLKSLSVQPDAEHSLEGANAIVSRLNFILKNFTEICHEIVFSKIIYAAELGFNEKLDKDKLTVMNIRRKLKLGIETQPNNATFEALLKKVDSKTWLVEGDISRTSTYRGLSDCILDKHIKNYCSCKNL